MTHDELLKKITGVSKGNSKWITNFDDLLTPNAKALRAVVELHRPDFGLPGEDVVCDWCKWAYPCPTIETIEKELE